MQTVRVLGAVRQPLRERVATGVAQGGVFSALQAGLGQQDRPDLTHGLTPLLLPAGAAGGRSVTKGTRLVTTTKARTWLTFWSCG